MRILVVGSGGREHTLAWALARSPQKPELFIAPGNAGTTGLGKNVAIAASDIESLLQLARHEQIDLTVIGPEEPLVRGIVDRFRSEGLPVLGPTAAAARLEGSKAFSKTFMDRYGVPTAEFRTFSSDSYAEACVYLDRKGAPIVIKADGLAAGKGALVCATRTEAREALDYVLKSGSFGEAGRQVVVEEFMDGEEASVFVLTDGRHYVILPTAQDHKRIGDNDTGPNTGGMGAYSPAPVATGRILTESCRTIVEPVLAGMAHEGNPYTGFLYVGLMITPAGPRVVEFNCRMGDPETQAVMPLLDVDLASLFESVAHGRLENRPLIAGAQSAACVVVASGGYPGPYEKGKVIRGLDEASESALVFHAGTTLNDQGDVVTSGGRVLGITGIGDRLQDALDSAYNAVQRIEFDGMYYRKDIGRKGLHHSVPA